MQLTNLTPSNEIDNWIIINCQKHYPQIFPKERVRFLASYLSLRYELLKATVCLFNDKLGNYWETCLGRPDFPRFTMRKDKQAR